MTDNRLHSRKLWVLLGLGVVNTVAGAAGVDPHILDPWNKLGTWYLGAQGVADLGKGLGMLPWFNKQS